MSEGAPDDVVAGLMELLSRSTGLSFTGRRGPWLRAAVSRAFDAHLAAGQGDAISDDSVLLDRLCDLVTVQESFFFRERGKLEIVRSAVLPELRSRSHTLVRVWSAGCARGEEAYTLAVLLAEAGLAERAAVLGTDISEAAIRSAERGVFGDWSLRGLDEARTAQYFTVERGGWRIRDRYRALVRFRHHNLLDEPPEAGAFDLVLCRNVLMYLTPEAVERAAQRLVAALRPGGWLVTSSSDPLLPEVEGLSLVRTDNGVAYRRDAVGDERAAPRATGREPALGRRAPGPRQSPPVAPPATSADAARLLASAERALELGHAEEAERLATRALAIAPSAHGHTLLAQALGEQGDLVRAGYAAAVAVRAHPLDVDAHLLQATLLLGRGDAATACVAARRAVYLEPRRALGHVLLARCHEELGHQSAARRARRNAARLLAPEDPS